MKNRRITKIIAIIAVVAMLASFFAISATADETTIPASGYAAIGVVDAGANKAEVLLGTGEQGTVFYNGNANAFVCGYFAFYVKARFALVDSNADCF